MKEGESMETAAEVETRALAALRDAVDDLVLKLGWSVEDVAELAADIARSLDA